MYLNILFNLFLSVITIMSRRTVNDILLPDLSLVCSGDTTYGANGALYEARRLKGKMNWIMVKYSDKYKEDLKNILKNYHKYMNRDVSEYESIKALSKNDENLRRMHEISKRIWDDMDELIKNIVPRYHSVNNFGKGTFNFLDRGFAYYLLFKILSYYGYSFRFLGVKVRSHSSDIPFNEIAFFNKVLEYLNKHMISKFSTIKRLLSNDMKLKWDAASKLNIITKIHLMITLLKANIREKRLVSKSKAHCNKLIKIYELLKKIKKKNIDEKSKKLNLYFELFREAVLDLVSVIDMITRSFHDLSLVPYQGSILPLHNNHSNGISRIQFGYSIYYLISNKYLEESMLWKWTSCRWVKKIKKINKRSVTKHR